MAETPRLYSRGYKLRAPVDEIAPQHEGVHALLSRWGAWAASRAKARGLASIESLYSKAGSPPATAPLSADPLVIACERAVVQMPVTHRPTVVMLYMRRFSAFTICRAAHIRYEDWPRWAFDTRAMVRNRLRRLGVVV